MVKRRLAVLVVLLATVLAIGAIATVLPLWNRSGGYNSHANAVYNGAFDDPESILSIRGFSLGPTYFCGFQNGSAAVLVHRWAVLHNENDVMIGSRSTSLYGVSPVDSRNAFRATITSGEGGRISLLQQLGPIPVNDTTRVHFSLDSLNSTGRDYNSVAVVIGPVWEVSNDAASHGYVLILNIDGLPNMSGWYDFDFSLTNLLQGLAGRNLSGFSFAGPCLSSRGVALGLETSSVLERGIFTPSPLLSVALTDVAVYDSAAGKDTMFKGSPFGFTLLGVGEGVESNVGVTTYNLSMVP